MSRDEDSNHASRQRLSLVEEKRHSDGQSSFPSCLSYDDTEGRPSLLTSSVCPRSSKTSIQTLENASQFRQKRSTCNGESEVGTRHDCSDGRVSAPSRGRVRVQEECKPWYEECVDTSKETSCRMTSVRENKISLPAFPKRGRNRRFHYTKKDGSRLNMLPSDDREQFYTQIIEIETNKMKELLLTPESANPFEDSISANDQSSKALQREDDGFEEKNCVTDGKRISGGVEETEAVENPETDGESSGDPPDLTKALSHVRSFTSANTFDVISKAKDGASIDLMGYYECLNGEIQTSQRRPEEETDSPMAGPDLADPDPGLVGRNEISGDEMSALRRSYDMGSFDFLDDKTVKLYGNVIGELRTKFQNNKVSRCSSLVDTSSTAEHTAKTQLAKNNADSVTPENWISCNEADTNKADLITPINGISCNEADTNKADLMTPIDGISCNEADTNKADLMTPINGISCNEADTNKADLMTPINGISCNEADTNKADLMTPINGISCNEADTNKANSVTPINGISCNEADTNKANSVTPINGISCNDADTNKADLITPIDGISCNEADTNKADLMTPINGISCNEADTNKADLMTPINGISCNEADTNKAAQELLSQNSPCLTTPMLVDICQNDQVQSTLATADISMQSISEREKLEDEDITVVSENFCEDCSAGVSCSLPSFSDTERSACSTPSSCRDAYRSEICYGTERNGKLEGRYIEDEDNNCCESFSSVQSCDENNRNDDEKEINPQAKLNRLSNACGQCSKQDPTRYDFKLGNPLPFSERCLEMGFTGLTQEPNVLVNPTAADNNARIESGQQWAAAGSVSTVRVNEKNLEKPVDVASKPDSQSGPVNKSVETNASLNDVSSLQLEESHGKPYTPERVIAGNCLEHFVSNESFQRINIRGASPFKRSTILPKIPGIRKMSPRRVVETRNVHFEEEESDTMKSVSSLGSEKSQTTCHWKSSQFTALRCSDPRHSHPSLGGSEPKTNDVFRADKSPNKSAIAITIEHSRRTSEAWAETCFGKCGKHRDRNEKALSPPRLKRSSTFSLETVVSKSIQVPNSNVSWANDKGLKKESKQSSGELSRHKRSHNHNRTPNQSTQRVRRRKKDGRSKCEHEGNGRMNILDTAPKTRFPPLPLNHNQRWTNHNLRKYDNVQIRAIENVTRANESQNKSNLKAEASGRTAQTRNVVSNPMAQPPYHSHPKWETLDEMGTRALDLDQALIDRHLDDILALPAGQGERVKGSPANWKRRPRTRVPNSVNSVQAKTTSHFYPWDKKIHISVQLEDVQPELISQPLLLKIYTNGKNNKPLELVTTPQPKPRPLPLTKPFNFMPPQRSRGGWKTKRGKMDAVYVLFTGVA